MLATESYRMHAKIACAQPGLQFERKTTQRKQQCLDMIDFADEFEAPLERRRRCNRQRRLGRPTPQAIEFEQRRRTEEIGRASGRERVCQYVLIAVVAGPLKKKNKRDNHRETKQKEDK